MASFFLFQTPFAALPIVALGGAFFLIVFGADMFGLLSLKAARRLGNASYGIYLLQGLVLSFVFFFKGTRGFEQSSPVDHWVAVMLCGVVLVLLAAVAHFLVEMPGVRLGEAAIKTVAEYRPPAKIPLEA
jgi:peptidoglycan/LPS O-acetylase OafA/YrhL